MISRHGCHILRSNRCSSRLYTHCVTENCATDSETDNIIETIDTPFTTQVTSRSAVVNSVSAVAMSSSHTLQCDVSRILQHCWRWTGVVSSRSLSLSLFSSFPCAVSLWYWKLLTVFVTQVLKVHASLGVSDWSSSSCGFWVMDSGMRRVSTFSIPSAVTIPWMRKGLTLQRVFIFQISKIHRQITVLIACFVQAYCVLHVQLVSRLCQKAFDVRFRSRHQEVVDVSSTCSRRRSKR